MGIARLILIFTVLSWFFALLTLCGGLTKTWSYLLWVDKPDLQLCSIFREKSWIPDIYIYKDILNVMYKKKISPLSIIQIETCIYKKYIDKAFYS